MDTNQKTLVRVTVTSVTINTLLAIFKIIIGHLGQSQALVADGLHSFSDLVSDTLVFIAARAGQKGADSDHPYGHRRIETFASVVISVLLIIVGVVIAYSTFERVFIHEIRLVPSHWVALVAFVSILCNEFLFRFNRKMGNRIHSNLLVANSLHNRSDAFVSLIVFASILGSYLGWHYLDAVAAVFIAVLIIRMGLKMMWNNVRELVDTGVDEKTREEIVLCIQKIPGIHAIHQLRTRSLGGNIFIDVHVLVDPKISVSEGHFISEQVYRVLAKTVPHITDTVVHIDPEDDEKYCISCDLPDRPTVLNTLEKSWKSLPAYSEIENITLHYLAGNLDIDIIFPVSVSKKYNEDLKKMYQDAARKVIDRVHAVNVFYRET